MQYSSFVTTNVTNISNGCHHLGKVYIISFSSSLNHFVSRCIIIIKRIFIFSKKRVTRYLIIKKNVSDTT